MKGILFGLLMALMAIPAFSKEIKEICYTTDPVMHCQSCENRIMDALRFEKGVKDVKTSVENQTVAIKYDADQTNPDALAAALLKAGYKTTEKVCDKAAKTCAKEGKVCDKAAKTCDKAAKTCAKEGKVCDKAAKTCDKAAKTCAKEGKVCDKEKANCAKTNSECPNKTKEKGCEQKCKK